MGLDLIIGGVGASIVAGDVSDLVLAPTGAHVGLVEESGEEYKVAKVHGERELDVEPGDVTLVLVLLQILGRPYVDDAADNHLSQLAGGDEHGDVFPRPVAHGTQRVVGVHDGVHAVVHDDVPACGRCVLRVGEPRVEQHGYVVVPVQEDEGLLAQNDEHRVSQLGQLGQNEQERPTPGHPVVLDKAATDKQTLCTGTTATRRVI